jgi:hypothetical protein
VVEADERRPLASRQEVTSAFPFHLSKRRGRGRHETLPHRFLLSTLLFFSFSSFSINVSKKKKKMEQQKTDREKESTEEESRK